MNIDYFVFTYAACGSICLTLACVLLFMEIDTAVQSKSLLRIRRLLAYTEIEIFVCDYLTVFSLINKWNLDVLNYWIFPVLYYVQILTMIIAVLGLIHSRIFRYKIVKRLALPIIIYTAIFLIGYLYRYFCGWLQIPIENFLQNPEPFLKVVYEVFMAFMFIFVALCIFWLITETKKYREKLLNFFTGNEIVDGSKLNKIVYAMILILVLSVADLLGGNSYGSLIYMCILIVLNIYITITLLNLQKICMKVDGMSVLDLKQTSNDIDEMDIMDVSFGKPMTIKGTDQSVADSSGFGEPLISKMEEDGTSVTQTDVISLPTPSSILNEPMTLSSAIEEPTVLTAIESWKSRQDKPYLKDGLTLSDVASDMNLNSRLLSTYINEIYQKNFNTWINTLRIEEVKNIIAKHPDVSLSDVAFQTGFPDQPSLTKTFKKHVGVTPSVYKNQVHNI